jgi:hypothetical protein
MAAIMVATVVVVSSESETKSSPAEPAGAAAARSAGGPAAKEPPRLDQFSAPNSPLSSGTSTTRSSSDASAVQLEELSRTARHGETGPFASKAGHRDVERAAEMVLGTDPADVRRAAGEVFEAVHAYDGIVLRSSIEDGNEGEARAEFELLIPSGKLGDALASFSAIAEVRSRHESTADVTAKTVGLGERLQDSRASVKGLLAQLANAETDAERAAAEAELHSERLHAAALRSRLADLQRRANLSHVTLRIETGDEGGAAGNGGSWGVGDALADAGHILGIAAGVTLIGLAIVGPLALLCLLAWLAHRAWVRRAREHALG